MGSALMDNLLVAINTLKLAHLPNTTLIAIHLTSPTPFVSSNAESDFNTAPPQATSEPGNPRSNKRHSPDHLPASNEQTDLNPSPRQYNEPSSYFTTDEPFAPAASKFSETARFLRSIPSSLDSSADDKFGHRWRRYLPPEEMSQSTKRAMLVLTVTDINTNVEDFFSERRQSSTSNSSRYYEVIALNRFLN